MTNKYINSLKTATKETMSSQSDSELLELMKDAAYLRQSSALINEALQKGFDVLQLENGDIVTTGTKTIVNQYSWNKGEDKLVKQKSPSKGKTSTLEDA